MATKSSGRVVRGRTRKRLEMKTVFTDLCEPGFAVRGLPSRICIDRVARTHAAPIRETEGEERPWEPCLLALIILDLILDWGRIDRKVAFIDWTVHTRIPDRPQETELLVP